MPLLAQSLDYSDRDFASLRVRLFALIRSVFPTWTDENVSDFGNILVELYAFVGDLLAFYQDNQARESRITTATQRKNLLALCKLIGFTPASAFAATVDETFTLDAPPIGNVTFPAGTVVSTADITDPVRFQLVNALTILAGANPPTATASVENSETHTDVFTSTGLPNQVFLLPSTPFLDASSTITASNGAYTEVANFLDSTSSDRHFVVTVDQNERAMVSFGNGINGAIPVGTITVTSKTGGGAEGNVDAGTIKVLSGSFADAFGNPVRVTVTNAAKASGGLDRQSNAQIKALAPETVRAENRTVAREDFEINAKRIAGVARALMTTSNEDVAVPENAGILYIVPRGGGLPSQALKDQVKAQFVSSDPMVTPPFPSTLTFRVNVQDPLYLTIDVTATVWFRAGVAPAVGAKAIRTALTNYFAISVDTNGVSDVNGTDNPNVNFGFYSQDAEGTPLGTLSLGKIFALIEDLPEVLELGGLPSDFLLNGGHADVPILQRQFPKLGTVTLTNGIDGSSV